ncbi:MAG: tetratricopeptide repeat protein [Vicinamibacteria bacterium]
MTVVAVLLISLGQAPAAPVPFLDCAAVVSAEAHDSAVSKFKTGEAAIQASKWAEAEAALLKAVAFDPQLALAHYGLGQTYMAQQRYQEATQAFETSREAFRCTPLSAEERKRRVEEVRELRDTVRSLDQRRLKEIGAKWKEANGDMLTPGNRMRTVQDAERRLEQLEASLKDVDPSPPGVTLALGTALFQTGAIAEAETAFRAVLGRDRLSGDAHHNLALICAITDRLEEAEREMAAAEKAGVPIHPRLREEIERRKRLKAR